MKTNDFNYSLPNELIARYPAKNRTESRLLVFDKSSGDIEHKHFHQIIDYLNPNDLLVLNDSRVIPARLFGNKESGGKVEILVERIISKNEVLAHVRASRSPKEGSKILVGKMAVLMQDRKGALFHLKFLTSEHVLNILEKYGHMPLPPYIDRADEVEDRERYQTVYAKNKGSVAAPTAGLHFDNSLLEKISQKGVAIGYVTLHVGAGTFQPVKVANVLDHKMHSEWITVDEKICEQINIAKKKGGRIIAVGTTSIRCLETAANKGKVEPFIGDTNIFIYPGYKFKIVDAMVTNFHLPESSLLMLVSAFAGREKMLSLYKIAIEKKYKFFSYGDAMIIY